MEAIRESILAHCQSLGIDFEALSKYGKPESLPILADCTLVAARRAQGLWQERRSTKARRYLAKLQDVLKSGSDFLKTYSEVLQMFGAIDSRFGSLAGAAVGLIFKVNVSAQLTQYASLTGFRSQRRSQLTKTILQTSCHHSGAAWDLSHDTSA
jgi:hypothetical protein